MGDLGVLVAVAAFVVTVLQWRAARVESRNGEVQLLRGLSDSWRALGVDWRRAIGIARGAGSYYNQMAWAEQSSYLALKRRVGVSFFLPDETPWPEASFAVRPEDERRVAGMTDDEARHELNVLADAVPRVVHFLAELSATVLSGRVGPDVVYYAFGSQLLNAASSIRVISRVSHYDYMLVGYHDKIVALLDILWAQAVVVDDVDPTEMIAHKRSTRSGVRNRRRVRRLARRHGNRLTATRLEVLLSRAEGAGRFRRVLLAATSLLATAESRHRRRSPSWAV
ncbi:hypothetical protein DQ237_10620 [Blastococcus sp. TF02-8]|uniref:hypothetical protein n=1 Tax=Blastococcus sp. TF02-8 TaxID=2250574 RepID=UPI000DE99944|nr:hypothetical protein [Blastococcus sp. TF02-8]RBY96298.1 hypothetical protein DQ237_10620 [Blastococcus sp. TF02-8]